MGLAPQNWPCLALPFESWILWIDVENMQKQLSQKPWRRRLGIAFVNMEVSGWDVGNPWKSLRKSLMNEALNGKTHLVGGFFPILKNMSQWEG